MCTVLIVADDLTGSLDAAAGFVRAGRRVVTARTVADVEACLRDGADVISVNTSSRSGSDAAAVAAIEDLARMIDPAKVEIVMKKVDSRLKGHPGAEARALARLAGRDVIVAAPALPRMGRVQSAGQLTGSGIDVAISMSERLGEGMIVPDVASKADLDALVVDPASRRASLWLGASDLAFALAHAEFDGAPARCSDIGGPLAIVVGSRDPITVAQVDRLSRDGALVHRAPNGAVGAVEPSEGSVMLSIDAGGTPCTEDEAGARFATGVAKVLHAHAPRTLLCSGGETANALLSRLGVGSMELLGEVAPGLPCCKIALPWGDVHLITKSGGFGRPDLLSKLASKVGLAETKGSNQDV